MAAVKFAKFLQFSTKNGKSLSIFGGGIFSSSSKRSLADAPAAAATQAAPGKMAFTFGSPYRTFYRAVEVKQIDVPSFSGTFGILPQHVPTLAVIKPGVVAVTEMDGNVKRFFVSSGSISVNIDSSVQVLAEEACELADLDLAACREGLANAQREASSATDDVKKAEGQINVEVYEALVKAAETA